MIFLKPSYLIPFQPYLQVSLGNIEGNHSYEKQYLYFIVSLKSTNSVCRGALLQHLVPLGESRPGRPNTSVLNRIWSGEEFDMK